MRPVAIYARVSTERQEKEETIVSQIGAIRDRIAMDNLVLDESFVYKDEGFSGSIIERPALDRLREEAKQHKFDMVYVYDYGRFSRDLTDLMVIKDEIEATGVRVVSLFERITGDSDTDRLLLQIMGAVHEYERKKIARRFHNGKMQKAKRGKLVGYVAPYGYQYDKDSESIIPYEPEVTVVRKIYDWVGNQGHTSYSVIKMLHDTGISPRKEKSEYWTKSPIDRILRNESYIGRHHYNKSESVIARYHLKETRYRRQQKTGRKQRDKSEWILHEIEPIVSQELFNKVQEQLKRNVKFRPTNRKHDYLLTGVIKCTCGENRNGDGPEGKKYYRCISRSKQHDHVNRCKVGGVNVTVADALIWQKISSLLSNPEQIRKHAERWLETQKNDKTLMDTKSLAKELRDLENEQKRYIEAYGKGIINEDMLDHHMKTTNKKKLGIETELTSLSKNRGITGKIDVDTLAQKTAQKLENLSFPQKKHIVERVVTKIIASQKEMIIWGQIPIPAFATSGKVNYEPEHRNCWLTERWQVDAI